MTHTFTAQVFTNDGSGAGYLPANGVTVTFAFVGTHVGSFTSSTTCTTAGSGTCTATTSSTTAGVDTVSASESVTVGGTLMTRTTGTPAPGTQQNSGNAVKTWVQPSILLTKNPKSQVILSGSTATFTIVVTNTGPVGLSNVTVADALSPNCVKTSAAIAGLALMAPGASITYTCTLANVTGSFTNSATATGTPVGGGPNA